MEDWTKILVAPDTKIHRVIEMIDKNALKIALVADENRKLLGTVTDGDIRRGILKGISLECPVHQIMNPKPRGNSSSQRQKEHLEHHKSK